MSGSLSLNGKKEKDTHPDYKGKIHLDGKTYWLSGWSKTNDSGDWISLSLKLADGGTGKAATAKAITKPAAYAQASGGAQFDDEIPF